MNTTPKTPIGWIRSGRGEWLRVYAGATKRGRRYWYDGGLHRLFPISELEVMSRIVEGEEHPR